MSREPATLIILAGGEAKRLGFPKHQLIVDGRRVIDTLHERLSPRFVETIVVGREIEDLPPDVRLVHDLYHIRSPLVGIHAGLTASTTDLTFVVACDMPTVEPSLVAHLLDQSSGFDVVVPVVRGYYEPLCAVYRRTC
ncbi:molybdenum cofactor guanylyltransferase, partial [Candidatus Bipolaricaulota bacterium]|nr:molybdenum cofactor guanylyltransferase [Candidatus Bipolaricaulota bacterium]